MRALPTLVNVSLIGNKHVNRGTPCEDSSFSKTANGVSVMCVSDGAGGAKYTHARFGSKCACETVADLLCRHFDAFYFENRESISRTILVTAIHSAMAPLLQEHELDGLERLSCTLLFVAVKGDLVLAGHIGDGMICRVSSQGISPVTLPANGENASSTYFITFPNAQEYLRFIRTTTDDTHAFVLMTDGVEEMVYDSSSQLIRPVVARLAELAAKGKVQAEEELKNTIQEFVVGAGQNTDDASVGIVYFSDTASPDFSSLCDSKTKVERDYNDTMKAVQMELIPKVKEAQDILSKIRCQNGDKSDTVEKEACVSDANEQSVKESAAETKPEEENIPEEKDIPTKEDLPQNEEKTEPVSVKKPKMVPLWAFLLVLLGFVASVITLILTLM